jgi:hypothetical protein
MVNKNNINEKDKGEYICIVENEYGSEKTTCIVNVIGK